MLTSSIGGRKPDGGGRREGGGLSIPSKFPSDATVSRDGTGGSGGYPSGANFGDPMASRCSWVALLCPCPGRSYECTTSWLSNLIAVRLLGNGELTEGARMEEVSSLGTGASYSWWRFMVESCWSCDMLYGMPDTWYGAAAPGGRARAPALLLWLILLIVRARMILPTVPNDPRKVSIPGSSYPMAPFSSAISVCARAAWRRMVERRSNLASCVGSTFDICNIVIPTHITKKPITSVIIEATLAWRPWKRTLRRGKRIILRIMRAVLTMVVTIEKNVTRWRHFWGGGPEQKEKWRTYNVVCGCHYVVELALFPDKTPKTPYP